MSTSVKKSGKSKTQQWLEQVTETADPRLIRIQEENERLKKQLGLVENYQATASKAPHWLMPKKKPEPMAGTACLSFSDLHLDEIVDPAQIGGLNAYSREIAELRLKRWADKVCELGDRFRHAWDGALVLWKGDMVSGLIHEELRETNADYLPGTLVYWAPRIASAIRQAADFYEQVHVSCVVGNHGRLTIKMPSKGRGRNSWDWLLTQMVRSHLENDKRITWDISPGSYILVPIYDRHISQSHGDEVKGGGGWAGVWSPLGTILRKAIEIAAAHNVRISYADVGHWHQLTLAHSRGLSSNGSLKGWDEFAACMRFRPEPAMQGWWVETPKHGVTLAAPVLVEDRKSEGW